MNSISSLDLIRAHKWTGSFFTTYALSLSFFEAVVLDALVRQGVTQNLILADVRGIAAALSEEGVRSAGRAYQVEPVAVAHGCFHPKLVVLTSPTEVHLLIGSGNLTFGGWGSNLECIEHLHVGVSSEALTDTADFLEVLATVDTVRHAASAGCGELAGTLRKFASGSPASIRVRVLHNLTRPIFGQLSEMAADLGGAERITIASPFFDGGQATNRLCNELGLDRVYVHAHHAGIVPGSFGSNWPKQIGALIEPISVEALSGETRHLHAKLFEIVCRRGRIVLSGSANATMAALDRRRNVELCVARINPDRSTAWHHTPSTPPVQVGPLSEATEVGEAVGVLRAVLLADKLTGMVLTPFPEGTVGVQLLTASQAICLGTSGVTSDGRFEMLAKGVEQESWKTQRIALRLESPIGKKAEGFVSFPDFAYITQRAGSMLSRFFAILASNETPEDVAAIINWFLEHPESLSKDAPPAGGTSVRGTQVTDKTVRVSDLLAPQASAAHGVASAAGKDLASWRRFMESVLACFRQPRGPITSEPASGTSEDDSEEPADRNDQEQPAQRIENTDWPFRFVDRLLDKMLNAAGSSREVGDAFWMVHYVCDRIGPDPETAVGWLDRVLAKFADHPPAESDRPAVEASLLVWADAVSAKPNSTRRRLLRIGGDLKSPAPAISLVPGFVRTVNSNIDVASLWAGVLSARTVPEEIRAFRIAGSAAKLDPDYPYLNSLPELKGLTDQARKRLVFVQKLSDYCRFCHVSIPTADRDRLREVGVMRHNCGRILLCEEF